MAVSQFYQQVLINQYRITPIEHVAVRLSVAPMVFKSRMGGGPSIFQWFLYTTLHLIISYY